MNFKIRTNSKLLNILKILNLNILFKGDKVWLEPWGTSPTHVRRGRGESDMLLYPIQQIDPTIGEAEENRSPEVG
jgi:hypothetical protein